MFRSISLALAMLVAGCGGDSTATPDAPGTCSGGEKECRADGVYTCDLTGTYVRTEACDNGCEATPEPHCTRSCSDAGVESICEGNVVKQCTGGETQRCDPGVCLTVGDEAVCATNVGQTSCQGRRADGTFYDLVCADATGVSPTQACDLRSGECVDAAFDCAQLASVPAGAVSCIAAGGDFYTRCTAGQPAVLPCETGTACSNDGSFNCYGPPTAGGACGGEAVCYPGLHCTQLTASGGSCVQPAGQIACNSTDVLAVCNDTNTGVACVDGTVWWWKDLTSWGGSCTDNHISLPAGGICIPGLADCQQGLTCDRSPYEISGVCRTPAANAPADCTLTGQVSTGLSCVYQWHACEDGHYYDIGCQLMSIGGQTVTLCNCYIDGTATASFGGTAACSASDIETLDAVARQSCGWDVTTVDVAQ